MSALSLPVCLLQMFEEVCVCVWTVAHSCLTLCNPMDCGPRGSSVPGILQARRLEKVAIPPNPHPDLPDPGIEPVSLASLALARVFFTTSNTWEAR